MTDFSIFVVLLSQFVLFLVGFHGFRLLSGALENYEGRLNALGESPALDLTPVLDSISETIEDIVAETLQNLEPPRAIDHVFGAVAQMIQARTMSMMNVVPALGDVVETIADNMTED